MKKLFTLFCLFTLIHLSMNIKAQDSLNFPFSDNINIENFVITSKVLSNNRIDFKFDIIGKYQRLDMAIYVGNTNDTSLYSTNRICTIYWNDDKDEPIYYPEKITKPFWHGAINSKYNNHVISGKYFLVITYWYNGVKQTKTLEFYKEPVPEPVKKNDVKISNVKIKKVGTSFSQPPMYDSSKPSSPTIMRGEQYHVFVTVQNTGELDINQQLSLLVKGYDTLNPNFSLFSFTSNYPSIKKGSLVSEFPIIISQGTSSNQNSLEMLIHIDPSNSLNDKNLSDNKHTLKYYYKTSNGFTKELESSELFNIEIYNVEGNKIKSTFVNDLEKGVQDIKKSLPKGHYYFNVDGKKSQVQIK